MTPLSLRTPISGHAIASTFVLSLIVLLGVSTCQKVSLERELAAAKLAPAKADVVTAQAKVETVTVRLAAAAARVDTVLGAVRTDTLMLAPQTAQDTAKAVTQLPALAAAHDSLKRSCGQFVVSCGEYRTAAESRFRADSVYQVGLEAALRGAAPSRLAAIWARVKTPIAFGLGVYVGARAVR